MLNRKISRLNCKGNLKRYTLLGIPVLSIFTLVGICVHLLSIDNLSLNDENNKVYATASANTSTSASLIVDNNNIYDQVNAIYGDINYISHKVIIAADNINGYALTITGPVNLISPSDNNTTADNVASWGYAWGAEDIADNALTYNNFTGSSQNLETNTGVANNSVNLTKKLAFAAKFTNDAEDGHYTASVSLNLTVTPKSLTLSDISTMQEMYTDNNDGISSVCAASATGETAVLIDVRDNSDYTVIKLANGQCWMTRNLRITKESMAAHSSGNANSQGTITVDDSDVVSNFTLPDSSELGFLNMIQLIFIIIIV